MRNLSDIARLEEARCALGTSEVALEYTRVAGGIASRGEPKSWVNTAVGLGMAGPVTADEIARLIDWYESAGHVPQVELCPYADDSLPPLLGAAGFRVNHFDQVFFRELVREEIVRPPHAMATGIELRVISHQDIAAIREVATVITAGFTPEGKEAREDDIRLFERCGRHARSTTIAAYEGGICVGGGYMEVLGEIVALYGLAVALPARGRGIQQALLAERLNLAARQGCTLATISGGPGMGTERNVRRLGFQVAYTRVIMKKPITVREAYRAG